MYAEAQEIYHRTDYTGNGVLKYAPRLHDLLEKTPGHGDLYLIGEAFADAELGPNSVPMAGYLFKVLTAQGPNATGGARNYLDADGNMVLGHALITWPVEYDVTGRYSYMVDGHGTIFQKDLGRDTATIGPAMTEFDPDQSWVPAQ